MGKFTEETLTKWTKPPSTSEETKLQNSLSMVVDALNDYDELKKLDIKVFGQGSYANDTNVKQDSDIDINVRLSDTIFIDIPENKKQEEYGYSDSQYKFSDYKFSIFNALVKKFGKDVKSVDKCITIEGNSYRTKTDVVPTFEYHRHDDNGTQYIGTKFISDSGKAIVNYPLQHIQNGINKNSQTQKRFKRLTRIYRRIRYKMIDEKYNTNDKITSFLLECLVWNVPNNIFNENYTWDDRLRESIIFLYNSIKDGNYEEWGEVSELLYLFRGRKWSKEDVSSYLVDMWNYLEYNK